MRFHAAVLATALVCAAAAAADPWDAPTLRDDGTATLSELSHGYDETHDLKTKGGRPDTDWFRLRQEPFSSYEVVVDAAVGDVTPVVLERVAADGTTVLQTSAAVGTGAVRSLRFENATAAAVDDQFLVVRSGGCTKCKADDVYRLRAYETTYAVPRFNNAGSQITVLVLQNPTSGDVAGSVRFWDAGGTLLFTRDFTMAAKASLILQTQIDVPGTSGSVTIANDARYGELHGKAIGLEPATGFSFDTTLEPRPR
jgi:opacity protein-like surface antigen